MYSVHTFQAHKKVVKHLDIQNFKNKPISIWKYKFLNVSLGLAVCKDHEHAWKEM